LIIFAGTAGHLDDVPLDAIAAFEQELYKFVETVRPEVLRELQRHPEPPPEILRGRPLQEEVSAGSASSQVALSGYDQGEILSGLRERVGPPSRDASLPPPPDA